METFPRNWPGPGEFPTQRPVTRSFDVFFDLRLNKRLSKQWWGWWFETLSCPLWRHCNDRTIPKQPRTHTQTPAICITLTIGQYIIPVTSWHLKSPALDCLSNTLFWLTPTEIAEVYITGSFYGNPPLTGGSPSQRDSNAENVSMWWRLMWSPSFRSSVMTH